MIQRAAIDRNLARALLHLQLEQGKVGEPLGREVAADLLAEMLGQELGGGVLDREKGAVPARKDVARFAVHGDMHRVGGVGDDQLRVPQRQEDLVIHRVHHPPGRLLEHAEVHDEADLVVERALDGNAQPVVVAVQRLALVAAEGDEVRRREDQVVLAHRHTERAHPAAPLAESSER